MVITGYTCLMQLMQLFPRQKSHRRTKLDITFLSHGFVGVQSLFKFLSRQGLSRSHNGKAVNSFPLIQFTGLQNFFFRQKVIYLTIRVVMCRLGTIFAILRAFAAATVNDGTKVHTVSHKVFPDHIRTLTQFFQIYGEKTPEIGAFIRRQIILSRNSFSCNDFLC